MQNLKTLETLEKELSRKMLALAYIEREEYNKRILELTEKLSKAIEQAKTSLPTSNQ